MDRWIPLKTLKSASNDEIALLDETPVVTCEDADKADKAAAWKTTVLSGAGVASFVLITNVSVLAWSIATFDIGDGCNLMCSTTLP